MIVAGLHHFHRIGDAIETDHGGFDGKSFRSVDFLSLDRELLLTEIEGGELMPEAAESMSSCFENSEEFSVPEMERLMIGCDRDGREEMVEEPSEAPGRGDHEGDHEKGEEKRGEKGHGSFLEVGTTAGSDQIDGKPWRGIWFSQKLVRWIRKVFLVFLLRRRSLMLLRTGFESDTIYEIVDKPMSC
jgi:hypothetical protein